MKISRLLILTALSLFGFSASAADLVEREQPTNDQVQETPVAFEVGKSYLLYNVSAQMYFTQGSTWSTRGCVVPNKASAVRVKVAKYTLDDVWDGKTYEIENYVTNRTAYAWYKACMDDAGNLYLDQTTWGNRFYEIQDQGSNVYRLMPNEVNALHKSDGTQFMGRDDAVEYDPSNDGAGFEDADQRLPLSALLTVEEGHHVDWVFFDASVFDVYDKAQELKALIATAEEAGIDVTAAAAVYNNAAATLAELQAAMDKLSSDMTNNTFNGFTPGTALDVSSLITNPDFAGDNLSGWSGSGFGSYGPKENAERFNMTYDTYQDIIGLRDGLYVAGVNAFYRAGDAANAYKNFKAGNDESKYAKFYVKVGETTNTTDIVSPYKDAPISQQGVGSESNAKDEETGVTYYIPNNMVAAEHYMHKLGLYKNQIFFTAQGGQIRLGVKKDNTVSNDWTIFDDFSLIYCGDDEQAYKAYVNYFKTQYPDYKAQRTEFNSDFASMGINYTISYMEAFDAFESNATSEAEALADVERLEAAYAPLKENVDLWNEYKECLKKAMETAANDKLDPEYTAPLADWAELDAEDEWNKQELTNEELRALIDQKLAEIEEAGRHLIIEDGEAEVTYLLTNPDFEKNGLNGWTNSGAWTGGTSTNTCVEAWNSASFDTYQIVKQAPQGIYRIEVQGFYRYGRGTDAWNYYNDQSVDYVKPGGAPVFVYLNGKKTPFQNVFDEKQEPSFFSNPARAYTDPNGEWAYPDQMDSSAECFSAGMYKQSAYGIIKEGQDMRIGVTGVSNQLGDSWVIWDNFKLFNCGKNAQAVLNVLPDEIANAETMLGQNMGKSIYAKLLAAVNAAKAALDTENGETMFNALSDLFDAEEDVAASVSLFTKLADANEDLMDAMGNSDNAEALAEAGNLWQTISDKLESHELENEDVETYMAMIDEMMTKLALPGNIAEASDLDPKEVSNVIRNNDFAANKNDHWSGTAAAFQTFGNAEMFNKNFNFYQDLKGLPAGTYELQVQGYYRAGEAVADYENFLEAPEKDNNAFLYAMVVNENGDSIYSSNPLKRLASEPYADQSEVAEGMLAVKTDTIDLENEIFNYITVANNMATAASEFDTGKYMGNSVIVKVGQDGKLRVGVMKNYLIQNDWTIFDNFQLFYYGTASEKQATPDGIEDIATAPAALVEFFTLDGRKASGAQRGLLIMKQTLSNGAVIVKKIQK